MLEFLKGITQSVDERVKSPYALTYIIVWSIYNWRLWMAIIAFDYSFSFDSRIIFFYDYYSHKGLWGMFIVPAIFSLLSLLIYLVFNYIGMIINLFFSLKVKPFIFRKIDSNKLTVSRERFQFINDAYNKCLVENDELNEKYTLSQSALEDQRKSNLKVEYSLKNYMEQFERNADNLKKITDDNVEIKNKISEQEIIYNELFQEKNDLLSENKKLNEDNLYMNLEMTKQRRQMEDYIQILTLYTNHIVSFGVLKSGIWSKSVKFGSNFKLTEFNLFIEKTMTSYTPNKNVITEYLIDEFNYDIKENKFTFIKTEKKEQITTEISVKMKSNGDFFGVERVGLNEQEVSYKFVSNTIKEWLLSSNN